MLTFSLGWDAVSHMVEELPNPSMNAPRVMVLAVVMGAGTAWLFLMVILFVIKDVEAVVGSINPLLEIYSQATQSHVGATCLCIFHVVSLAAAVQAMVTIASRMVMAMGRDHAFGLISRHLGHVSKRWHVPIWSLTFCCIWVIIFGLIRKRSITRLTI